MHQRHGCERERAEPGDRAWRDIAHVSLSRVRASRAARRSQSESLLVVALCSIALSPYVTKHPLEQRARARWSLVERRRSGVRATALRLLERVGAHASKPAPPCRERLPRALFRGRSKLDAAEAALEPGVQERARLALPQRRLPDSRWERLRARSERFAHRIPAGSR